MEETLKIYCKNIKEYVEISGGDSLLDVYNRISKLIPFTPICARVNNRTEDLHFPVYGPRVVEYLPITSPSGERTYNRSLCMVLYKAVVEEGISARLIIGPSISGGNFCRLHGDVALDDELIERLKARMQKIIDAGIPFERREKLTSDVIKIFEKQGLSDKVRLLSTQHSLYTVYYRLDGLCDYYYGSLAPSTEILKTFDLRRYKDGMLLYGFDKKNPETVPEYAAQEKVYNAFTDHLAFNNIIGVRNVGELNERVNAGGSAMIVNVSEALHDKRIASIADNIAQRFRAGGARVVLVAGPSSSGKTTFTKRLAIHLLTNLIEPQMISLDNYFVDRHHTPIDEDGEYDYESLYALDLEKFNADLTALLRGEEVEIPYYNFATGAREYRGDKVKLNEKRVLIIEGIHGLNPELTSRVPSEMKHLIYVSALTTLLIDDHNRIPTTDNRLLRRIIRDVKYRGVSATDTIRRWPSVRRGEEKWIFPYQENADDTFNSSLAYELAVMKPYGERALADVRRDEPEFAEAERLRTFLEYFEAINESHVPSTSLLREFLGGSSFKY